MYLSGNVTLVKEEKILPDWKKCLSVCVWHMTTVINAKMWNCNFCLYKNESRLVYGTHINYELGHHGKTKMFQKTVQNNQKICIEKQYRTKPC